MILNWHCYKKKLYWEHFCKQDRALIETHRWHHTAGADAVIEACPALVVGVLALMQHVLIASIVWLLVGHPTAALHSYRVAAAEVVLHLGTVTTALIVTTLEVPVLVKDNLHTHRTDIITTGLWQHKMLHMIFATEIAWTFGPHALVFWARFAS